MSVKIKKEEEMSLDLQELMYRQPIINVGVIGHVANGKSSIVKCLTSKDTQQFAKEKGENKTIKLGYANAKIWECLKCPPPISFSSSDSSLMSKRCLKCNELLKLVNHISFVDCPGHDDLTSIMLNGSSVMDYNILLEASNNTTVPAPQTEKHVIATNAAKIPTCMVIMNKVDLSKKENTREKIKIMENYISKLTNSDKLPPIIPVSATLGVNIDIICQQLSMLKVPSVRSSISQFKMIVIRSFDINKPGVDVTKLNGGVIGGTIKSGTLKVGDKINIYPGMVKTIQNEEKKINGADFKYKPITGEVLSIKSDMNNLDYAIPGGLLGIQLTIDPAFSKSDHLTGSLVIKKNDIDETKSKTFSVSVYDKIIVEINKFMINETLVAKMMKEKPNLMINFNSNNIGCKIHKYKKSNKNLHLFLNQPIAIESQDRLATIMNIPTNIKNSDDASRNIIGRGMIIDGESCELME